MCFMIYKPSQSIEYHIKIENNEKKENYQHIIKSIEKKKKFN